ARGDSRRLGRRFGLLFLRDLLDRLLYLLYVARRLLSQELVAGRARGLQYVVDMFREFDVDYGAHEVDVAEMARGLLHGNAAGLAAEAGVHDAEPRVDQAAVDGVAVVVVGVRYDYLSRRHLPDHLRREQRELKLIQNLLDFHIHDNSPFET